MNEISIKAFEQNYNRIIEMIEQITSLKNAAVLYKEGEDFDGISIEEGMISYKSRTYFSGCGEEEYYIEIALEDMSKPLSFFEEKIAKKVESNAQLDKRIKERKIKEKEEAELNEYKRLKNKFEK